MACIKRAKQANALFTHLEGIYKASTDFASGNIQPYIEEHEHYRESEDDPEFDPFEELYNHFESGMIDDLPPTIEQYRELLDFLHNFGEYRERLDRGFTESFGFTSLYVMPDEEGNETLFPREDLSEDEINRIDANRQIESISIEYCLDGYNEFYTQCLVLIKTYRISGTIETCAKDILALYSPYAYSE
ncbi:hypothetical protein [Spirosoma endbachense]|uniref:Uncharacterized protein n=1 Tax=Spirosoma endbachense TaxID=2666025 RepID=A0A6P1VWU5_9BACT|nr:hypothetical protein [Spirosoma endbachense]QHV96552.1 hypothetical protein GJR95_16710 [Spirosoma endbachense]